MYYIIPFYIFGVEGKIMFDNLKNIEKNQYFNISIEYSTTCSLL